MNRKKPSVSELRRQVEQVLKHPVSDEAWLLAEEDRAVSEVQQDDNDVEWLARKVARSMEIFGQQPRAAPEFITRRQRRGKATQGRREAISSALAEIARQDEDVLYFRRTVLNDQLLQFEEVDRWIQERRSDATYPHAIIVRIKNGLKFNHQIGWQLEPPLSSMGPERIEGLVPVDTLAYAKKGDRWKHIVPIGRDGTLRTVWRLSNSLARKFRWQEAQATMFLLTDMTPLLSEEVTFNPPCMITLPWGGLLPLSCLTRVTLIIDPMMAPREIAQKYARIRAKLLSRKPRTQGEKHLQLAVFAVKYPTLSREAMVEWGLRFPDWKYTRVSLFARDARIARQRLLQEHPVDFRMNVDD